MPAIKEGLNISLKALGYANPDYLSVGWGDINDVFVAGKAAMMIMGDWTPGVLWSKNFKDFSWSAAPGNGGIYQMLSDSFGLPAKCKNRDAAIGWLKVCGSKEGQDAFNPAKGSIPARNDADVSKYTEYHKWAMEAWKKRQDHPQPRPWRGCQAELHDRLHEHHQPDGRQEEDGGRDRRGPGQGSRRCQIRRIALLPPRCQRGAALPLPSWHG